MSRRYTRLLVFIPALVLLMIGILFAPQPIQAQQFGSNWSAQYYPCQDLTCAPTVTRTESAINFNYGASSPDPLIPVDNFSARFTGTQTFTAGTYTFTLTRDDGARVYLDSQLIMNHTEGGVQTFQTTISVSAGAHNLVVEFIESNGNAQIVFSWQQVSVGTGGGTTITTGQTVMGTITAGGTQSWAFNGNVGDVVTIAVNAGSPATLDPRVVLLGPSGTQLAANDDILAGVNLNALIQNLTLTQAGAHTIVVSGFGTTAGAYTLTLTITSGGQTTATTIMTAQVVSVRGLSVRSGPYLGGTFLRVARPENNYGVIARNQDEGIYTWYLLNIPVGATTTETVAVSVTAIPGVTAVAPTPAAAQYIQGWSSGRYLQLSGDPNTVPVRATIFDQIDGAAEVGVLAVPRAPMNLRRRPSTRTQVLAEVPWGAVVPIIGRTIQGGENYWLQVRFDGVVGWIFAPYVTIRGDVDTVPIR